VAGVIAIRAPTVRVASLTTASSPNSTGNGDIAYINAGHNVPVLAQKVWHSGAAGAGGIPIGIFAESPYQVGTTRLENGDWLVIFTDGMSRRRMGNRTNTASRS